MGELKIPLGESGLGKEGRSRNIAKSLPVSLPPHPGLATQRSSFLSLGPHGSV